MGVNIQELVKSNVLGNIRTGTRKNDIPVKFGYFDVHMDRTTSSLAVELFNQVYNKPTSLKIRFIDQNPMEIHLERYDGKKRRCYGNGKEAIFIDDKGKKQRKPCDSKNCPYFENGECKYIARLKFLTDKLQDEGLWCYPTGNQKGIKKIAARIARANRKGEDLTKDWYELFLVAEDSSYKGKNYVPDIRKLEPIEIENNVTNQSCEEKTNISQNKSNISVNYLMVLSFEDVMYNNSKVKKIKFKDTSSNEQELILLPEANQEIITLQPRSIIQPISISRKENIGILNDYKIIKKAA